ncbi:MAG: branched-chain amino acid ABC transporter permease [Desulfarculaceae bacterium]|nr:branched-chain amino acid ABC transporter permease [Desulfarculaceae bacterium]MCF8102108.1 branched-chain amino acid ABC transporter permease [Desulfarculaceae bacterium]MCF8118347.1 branched-chain amino acid ABC transporter permease [Desulfarculaceae bacterium]
MGLIYALNGLYFAAFLFLTSLGLSIILGVMGILNLAHGSLYAIGGFIAAYFIGMMTGCSALLMLVTAAASAMVLAGVVGLVIETTLLKPMYKRPLEYQLLITFGILMLIEDLIKLVFGGESRYASAPFDAMGSVQLMGHTYPVYFLFVMGITALAGLVIWWIMAKTKLGIMLRAIEMDRDMSQAMGIPMRRLTITAFVLGAALAGLAGALVVPTTPAVLGMGMDVLIMAFIVVVIGGLGSLKGTLVGSLLVGLTRSFTVAYFAEMEMPLLFLIAVVILVIKPEGLFGQK